MNGDPWDRFVGALAARFQDLVWGDTMVISRGRHFVQLAHYGDMVHGEAVSDSGLPADQPLTPAQKDALVALGWQPPKWPKRRYPNYWLRIPAPPAPGDSRRLATLFALTLRDVYGVESPDALERKAWNDETGTGIPLTW